MKKLLLVALLTAILGSWAPAVYASETLLDPATVPEVYSGVALLQYYSNSLDYVIQENTPQTEKYLGVMPFAHVPPAITNPSADFAQSSISITQLMTEVGQLLSQRDKFITESRLSDALDASEQISADITQALGQVDILEQATVLTGDALSVAAVPAQSDLSLAYSDVMAKIGRIRNMLNILSVQQQNSVLENPVIQSGLDSGTLTNTNGSDILQEALNSLHTTDLTLEITPLSAYVGDKVHFDSVLTSGGLPIIGRSVSILLDGTQFVSVTTDTNGHCSGDFALPFWYAPQIEAQAFYQPQGSDIGLFLAGVSPILTLHPLYYNVFLQLNRDSQGYPGKSTTINGSLEYPASPPLSDRKVNLYLDDRLVATLYGDTSVSFNLAIDPGMKLGQHLLILYAPGDGRYAPAMASAPLEVTRGVPVLLLDTPRVALAPGSAHLSGQVYSALGPLDGAAVTIRSGNASVEATTASDGTFQASLKLGMAFTLIGSQSLSVRVTPVEPWNAPLSASRGMFSLNYINCALAVLALLLLGIYVPIRLRKRLGYLRSPAYHLPGPIAPDLVPAYRAAAAAGVQRVAAEEPDKPRSRIFYWYRQVLKLLQKLAGLIPRPQQTMREFARESGSTLGPISKYLLEITLLTERFLYGSDDALQADADKSRELSQSIVAEVKNETD